MVAEDFVGPGSVGGTEEGVEGGGAGVGKVWVSCVCGRLKRIRLMRCLKVASLRCLTHWLPSFKSCREVFKSSENCCMHLFAEVCCG